MPLIWRLKLPVRQRIAVISIFGMGIVVNVAGAVRTAFVYKSMLGSYDTTWVGWPIFLAAAIEINLGLVRHFGLPFLGTCLLTVARFALPHLLSDHY